MPVLNNVDANRVLTDALFLDRVDVIPDQLPSEDLDRLLKVAFRNRLTSRLLRKFSESSPEWQEKLAHLIQYQENRREKILAFVEEVNTLFQEEGVRFVLMKTFDNYPDFGHDLDYLIGEDFEKARNLIEERLGGEVVGNLSVADRIVGKLAFNVRKSWSDEVSVELEIYPKISQVGEETINTQQIIERAKVRLVDGAKVIVPSKEDQILITCFHAEYRSLGFRLSEIFNSLVLIKKNEIDWDYTFDQATRANISRGLSFMLRFLEEFHENLLGEGVLSQAVLRRCEREYASRISLPKEYPNNFGYSYFLRTYLNRGIEDVLDFRIRSAGLVLVVAPVLAALESLIFHTTGKTNLIW